MEIEEEKKTELHESMEEEEANPKEETPANKIEKKCSKEPSERDIVLARVAKEKKLALVKAWEDNEKAKAENKASSRLHDIESWENSQKALTENKKAEIRMAGEEKRAGVEARRQAKVVKVEEMAANYRATGTTPRKFLIGCFSRN
ncbi:hypothetical protein V2J09_020250 [Rumex salicifolius]